MSSDAGASIMYPKILFTLLLDLWIKSQKKGKGKNTKTDWTKSTAMINFNDKLINYTLLSLFFQ